MCNQQSLGSPSSNLNLSAQGLKVSVHIFSPLNGNTWTRASVRSRRFGRGFHSASPVSLSLRSISPSPSPGLSCSLASAEPRVTTVTSFLHPNRPCHFLPRFVQCLPDLFPNLALLGCVTTAPVDGGWAQVPGRLMSSLAKPRGTHERGLLACSRLPP